MYQFTKQKDSDLEKKLTVTKREKWGGGGITWEVGINIYTLIYIKEIPTKTYSIAQGILLNTL